MLFIFYLTLTVVKFASRELVQNYPYTCVFSGFVIQYSYMSALFWLNSMGYFMWTQFRKLTPVYNQGTVLQDDKFAALQKREYFMKCL